MEDAYVMKDPFTEENAAVVLGSHCASCEKSVCVSQVRHFSEVVARFVRSVVRQMQVSPSSGVLLEEHCFQGTLDGRVHLAVAPEVAGCVPIHFLFCRTVVCSTRRGFA